MWWFNVYLWSVLLIAVGIVIHLLIQIKHNQMKTQAELAAQFTAALADLNSINQGIIDLKALAASSDKVGLDLQSQADAYFAKLADVKSVLAS